MPVIKTFDQAREALSTFYGFSRPGEYTLETMQSLMKFVGDPQNSFKTVHIAGTSGKTSTAYYTAALLTEAGYKTGLTVSPHVDEINERVQLNMQPLEELTFCRGLGKFLELVKKSGVQPSYFELMVAFAFWQFAQLGVDYAVIEVGLGGLMDGTNVITRPGKLCVITDIGLDHTEVLGNTIEEIAAQKAGIIQPGNHVYMNLQPKPVMDVVDVTCQRNDANLHIVDSEEGVPLSNLPQFQWRNFHLAKEVVRSVYDREGRRDLSAAQYEHVSNTYVPARMETIKRGSQIIIIDGSHNGQKIGTLMQSIRQKYPDKTIAALVGFVAGPAADRWQQGLDALLPSVDTVIATSFAGALDLPRHSVSPQEVTDYVLAHATFATTIEPAEEAFAELLLCKQDVLLVVGSFYLLNHIRPLLRGARL